MNSRILKCLIIIFCLSQYSKSWAQVPDSADVLGTKVEHEKKTDISFNISFNKLIPLADLKKMLGPSSWGVAPGFSFLFNNVHLGLVINLQLDIWDMTDQSLKSYLRDKFDELKNYNDSTGVSQPPQILGIYGGFFYQYSLPVKINLKLFVTCGTSNSSRNISYNDNSFFSGSKESAAEYFHNQNEDRIIYTLYPEFGSFNINMSIEVSKEFGNRLSLGLRAAYYNTHCNVEITENRFVANPYYNYPTKNLQ
ncbi:MAG: hypothetical protein ABI763_04245 [Bacteroidota bacterium]